MKKGTRTKLNENYNFLIFIPWQPDVIYIFKSMIDVRSNRFEISIVNNSQCTLYIQ